LLKSPDYEAVHNVIFSTLLLTYRFFLIGEQRTSRTQWTQEIAFVKYRQILAATVRKGDKGLWKSDWGIVVAERKRKVDQMEWHWCQKSLSEELTTRGP